MKSGLIIVCCLIPFSLFAQERTLVVDLHYYEWTLYENGEVIAQGQASGGRKYCPDIKRKCKTPIGNYTVLAKKNKYYRSPLYPLGCNNKSKIEKERCAKMAYAIKFKSSGEAIHASNDNWKDPYNISHGCVHTSLEEAAFLNSYLLVGDKIEILPY